MRFCAHTLWLLIGDTGVALEMVNREQGGSNSSGRDTSKVHVQVTFSKAVWGLGDTGDDFVLDGCRLKSPVEVMFHTPAPQTHLDCRLDLRLSSSSIRLLLPTDPNSACCTGAASLLCERSKRCCYNGNALPILG